jgi:hypothetical protein
MTNVKTMYIISRCVGASVVVVVVGVARAGTRRLADCCAFRRVPTQRRRAGARAASSRPAPGRRRCAGAPWPAARPYARPTCHSAQRRHAHSLVPPPPHPPSHPTACRYYSSSERMTTLLTKISNQVVRRCKEHIMGPGKIWDQAVPELIANMRVGAAAARRRRSRGCSGPPARGTRPPPPPPPVAQRLPGAAVRC